MAFIGAGSAKKNGLEIAWGTIGLAEDFYFVSKADGQHIFKGFSLTWKIGDCQEKIAIFP